MVRDFYCGVRDPRGKRYGSMEECAEAGEVRYYGLNKIDRRIVAAHVDSKKREKNRQDLITKLIVYRAKLQNFVNDLKFAKTKKETEEIQKKIDEFSVKKRMTIEKIKFIDESKKNPPKEPAKKEPVKKESSKKEPVKKESSKKEPAKKESSKKEPVKKESSKKEPAKKESSKKEPAKKEPAKKEPVKKEPVKKTATKGSSKETRKEPSKKAPSKNTATKVAPDTSSKKKTQQKPLPKK